MKVYETYKIADRWERITSVSLRDVVDILRDAEVVPNTQKLEDWLQPSEDESIEEALQRQYGQTAVNIINQLFDI